MDPNIQAPRAVFNRHLKYLYLGVVMGVAVACCSFLYILISELFPLMGPKGARIRDVAKDVSVANIFLPKS